MTASQKDAILSEKTPILVSASAGSGKTLCLTSRFLIKILDRENRISPKRLLLITFSKLAAKEMYNRIKGNMESLLKIYPNRSNIKKIYNLISKNYITTIDSFCFNILKENFRLCNISPNFNLVSESQIVELKHNIIDSIFEKFYKKDEEQFQNLCDYFSLKSNVTLKEVILNIYSKSKSQPFPELYIENMLLTYKNPPNFESSGYVKEIRQGMLYKLEQAKTLLYESKSFLTEELLIKNFEPVIDSIILIVNKLEYNIKTLKFNELNEILCNIEFESFPRYGKKNNPFNKELAEKIKTDYINPAKKIINSLKDYIIVKEEYLDCFKKQEKIVAQLHKITLKFFNELEKEKNKRNILEFSDLITKTLKIIATPSLNGNLELTSFGKKLSRKFAEVLVDEFQDINSSQSVLIKIISNNENNLFAVGDLKQSIYGFRDSDIKIFISNKDKYSNKNSNGSLINLNANFRSRVEITNLVNFLFGQLMSYEFGGTNYKVNDAFSNNQSVAVNLSYAPELHILKNDTNIDDNEFEMQHIANVIKTMLTEKFKINCGGKLRACEPQDFAVLFRTNTKAVNILCEKLANLNISFNCLSNTNFLKSFEISILISLLKIISNPTLDIPFCAVAISPMFKFTKEELVNIKIKSEFCYFFKAFKKYKTKKCLEFVEFLEYLIKKAGEISLEELIEEIYNNEKFIKIFTEIEFNNVRYKNLEFFMLTAKQYNNYNKFGLTGFLQYIEMLKNEKHEIKTTNNINNNNSVNIMSIHKSKGLEFPIVFIPQTNKRFNEQDFKKPILISSKFGVTLKHSCKETLSRYNTLPFNAAIFYENKILKEQELRLLYVATTRAKDKLILTTTDNKNTASSIKTNGYNNFTLPAFYCVSQTSFYSWMLASFARYQTSNIGDIINFKYCNFNCVIKIKNKFCEIKENNEIKKEHLKNKSHIVKKLKAQIETNNNNFETIPAKISVTELSKYKSKNFRNTSLKYPNLNTTKAATPKEVGTAMHSFLQFANFKGAEKNLQAEVKRLVENGFITLKQAELLKIQQIKSFFSSEAYNIIKKSNKIYKEKSFILEVNAGEIFKKSKNQKILIQGIIDCLAEIDGKLIIIDYKTDKTDENTIKRLYKEQMKYYKYAIEKLTKKQVKLCIIYSTCLNKTIKI